MKEKIGLGLILLGGFVFWLVSNAVGYHGVQELGTSGNELTGLAWLFSRKAIGFTAAGAFILVGLYLMGSGSDEDDTE